MNTFQFKTFELKIKSWHWSKRHWYPSPFIVEANLKWPMMKSSNEKHFPRYWPFVRGIHRSPANSLHKGQWGGPLMFSFNLRLNKQLSKQSLGWWVETSSRPLWRHCNANVKNSRAWRLVHATRMHFTCTVVLYTGLRLTTIMNK